MFGASSAERMEQMERARKYLADVQGDEPLVPERNAEDRPIDASTSAEQIMRAALGRYAENQVDGARERLMRSGYYREALAVRKKLQAQTARNRCARFFLYVLVVALVVLAFLLASMYVRDDGKREVDISATVTAMQYHPKTLALKSQAEQLHHRTKRTFGALVQTSSDPRALVHLRRGRYRDHEGNLRNIADNSASTVEAYTHRADTEEEKQGNLNPPPGWTVPSPPPLAPLAPTKEFQFLPKVPDPTHAVAHCGGSKGCYHTWPYECPKSFHRRCVPGREDSVETQLKRFSCVPLTMKYAPLYINHLAPRDLEFGKYTGNVSDQCLMLHRQDIVCKLTLKHCLYKYKAKKGKRNGLGDLTPMPLDGTTSCGAIYKTDSWTKEQCCEGFREQLCIVDQVTKLTVDRIHESYGDIANANKLARKMNDSAYFAASKDVSVMEQVKTAEENAERMRAAQKQAAEALTRLNYFTVNPNSAWSSANIAPPGFARGAWALIPMGVAEMKPMHVMQEKCGCNEDRWRVDPERARDPHAKTAPNVFLPAQGHPGGGLDGGGGGRQELDYRSALLRGFVGAPPPWFGWREVAQHIRPPG